MDVANSVDFNETLKRRLGLIQQQGEQATDALKQQEYRHQTDALAQEQEAYNSTLNQSQFTPTGGKDFNSFVNAVVGQESGGKYGAVNPDSGALGRYQIMPNNVAPWARKAGLGNISANQFLQSPEIQNRVARYKLQQYYNMYGAAGAAVAWYAGPGTARKYVRGVGNFNKSQGDYPSIQDYVNSVMSRMGY
jgi:hypothetical protein